jgi:hypothetical protein
MLGSGLCSQAGKWGKRLRSVTLMGSGCFGDGRCARNITLNCTLLEVPLMASRDWCGLSSQNWSLMKGEQPNMCRFLM